MVDRNFRGETVNGLSFTTISDATAGGRQIDGFHGLSIEYMRSRRFLQADGGWNRVVWIPKSVKERIKEFMPPDIIEKVATEEEAKTLDELKVFLTSKNHPLVETWKTAPAEEAAAKPKRIEEAPSIELSATALPITGLPAGMNIRIILKDAKITVKKLIIKPNPEK